eukprot:m.39987 g.39987  ORF g.39987 m.39987 type:complete len:460 (-) comp6900_c0_seq1:187-1566(-)
MFIMDGPSSCGMILLCVCLALLSSQASFSVMGQDVVLDNANTVPFIPRMQHDNGSVVINLPLEKTVVFSRFSKEDVDVSTIDADIEAIISSVSDTTDIFTSNVQTPLSSLAAPEQVASLSAQLAALEKAADNNIEQHKIEGISNLVNIIVSQTKVTGAYVNQVNDVLPALESNIEASVSLVTETYTNRIGKIHTFDQYGDVKGLIAPRLASLSSLKDKLDVEGSMAVDNFVQIEKTLESIEQKFSAIQNIGGFTSHFSKTHFGNPNLPVFRFSEFSTYAQCCGWYYGNRAEFYGGLAPSTWSNGDGRADQMVSDPAILRNLFNKRVYCGWNCAVHNEEWYYYSSDNGRHGAVLMRIRNTLNKGVDWRVSFIYSSYGGWSEQASMSLNGDSVWSTGASCNTCTRIETLTLPANRISTLIFVVGSGPPSSTRTSHLAFYDGSLQLPDGLEWVDDLDTIEEL